MLSAGAPAAPTPPVRRFLGAAHVLLGFTIALACNSRLVDWDRLLDSVLGPAEAYVWVPGWRRTLEGMIPLIPWIVLGLLALTRLGVGPVVRPLAFAVGILSFYVVFVGLFAIIVFLPW